MDNRGEGEWERCGTQLATLKGEYDPPADRTCPSPSQENLPEDREQGLGKSNQREVRLILVLWFKPEDLFVEPLIDSVEGDLGQLFDIQVGLMEPPLGTAEGI